MEAENHQPGEDTPDPEVIAIPWSADCEVEREGWGELLEQPDTIPLVMVYATSGNDLMPVAARIPQYVSGDTLVRLLEDLLEGVKQMVAAEQEKEETN